MKRIGLLALLVGWVAYLVSWFVPVEEDLGTLATGVLPGWEAVKVALSPILDRQGIEGHWYLQVIIVMSALTNLGALFSAVVFSCRPLRRHSLLAGWAMCLGAVVNSYWFFVLDRSDLQVGYYLWWFSFLVLALGLFVVGRAPRESLAGRS